jgi:hypothetical protein
MHLHATRSKPTTRSAAARPASPPRAVAQLAKGAKGTSGGKKKAVAAAPAATAAAIMPNNPNETRLGWDGTAAVTVWNSAKNYYSDHVGTKAWVDINPKRALPGHETTSHEQANFYDFLAAAYHLSFIRGHLINADFGGSNIVQNLFPITANANGQHKNHVENHVKEWLSDKLTWGIHYEVGAQQGANVVQGARFRCKATRFVETATAIVGDKKLDRTIYSYPAPPPKTSPTWDHNDKLAEKVTGIKAIWKWIGKSGWAHQPGLSAHVLAQIGGLTAAPSAKKAGGKPPAKTIKKPKKLGLFRSTKVPAKLAAVLGYYGQ